MNVKLCSSGRFDLFEGPFNPASLFCRPHLTNDVRTASVHLSYPDPRNLVASTLGYLGGAGGGIFLMKLKKKMTVGTSPKL